MSMLRGWLILQWWVGRLGTMRAIAVLICLLAAGTANILVPHLRSQEKNDRAVFVHAKNQLLSPLVNNAEAGTPNADPLATFYDALGDSRHAEQQLKTLFDLAQKNNLRLSSAEYKSVPGKNSRVRTLQITLPVNATYPAIRQFAEQVLLAIPFASLDELRFRRDGIGNPLLEAHLRFSLYLLEPPATLQSPPELVR